MGHAGYSFPPGVLVAVAEERLREALIALLRAEGYVVVGAASLGEALKMTETTTFALLLADLPTIPSGASPTLHPGDPSPPLGILNLHAHSPQEEEPGPFAFTLFPPLQVTRLLAEVAACLNMPFSAVQTQQAAVLKRFLSALVAKAWSSMASLCTEDVRYFPPTFLLQQAEGASPPRGSEAIQAYVSSVWQDTPRLRLEGGDIFRRPNGLALRYVKYTLIPDGGWAWQEAAELFQFAGARIVEFGFPPQGHLLP